MWWNYRHIRNEFWWKNLTFKIQNFYILISLLSIAIVLLITISVYCCLIKYQGKHLLLLHNTNNKLNAFCIDSINLK